MATEKPTSVDICDEAMLERIIELARASKEIKGFNIQRPSGSVGLPENVPVIVKYGDVPVVTGVREFLEPYRTAPQRRVGTAHVTTRQSFIDLVMRHKDENSVIFSKTDWPDPRLLAVIDYHTNDGVARFGTHRIQYDFPLTEEFKVWMRADGILMEQHDFCAFLEEHAAELAAPYDGEKSEYEFLFKERFAAPSEVINLSRSLEIFVGQKIKRTERLQTGERTVVFETQHLGVNSEPVDIPGIFMVSVRAFVDGDPVRIPARLRYRASAGELKWGYQLYRAAYWLRCQVRDDLDVAAAATGLPAFEGAPEQ